jgi:hypothetical protein
MPPSKTRSRKFSSPKAQMVPKDLHQRLKRPARRNLMSKLTLRFRTPLRSSATITYSSGSRA